MKRRLLATFLSLCLLVGLLPTVALAADEETGAELSAVCTCEALCTEEAVDETCPVCAEDYTLCTYAAPDEPVCAQLDGCVNGAHAADCPLYVEPTDDTLQEQEQEEPAAQPVTSTESTADLLSGTVSSSTSQALEGAEGSDLTWELTDGTLTISGTGAMKDYGYSGRAEVPWYDQRDTITKVVFGDGVTHIGSFAFYQHTALTSFEMTDSVVSFGQGAFQGCSALTTMPKLHANFQDFSTEVFVDAKIEAYEVDPANPYYTVKDGILYSKDGTTLINCPPGKEAVFSQNWLDGVTTIAPYAFRTCRSLTGELVIPAHITSIGRQAFQNCSGLTGDLIVPNTVTDLDGYYTFAGMSGMTGKLTLESNITEIAGGMFSASGFTSMVWQGTVTSVDNNAFTGCKFTGFALPESLTTVGNYAFRNCVDNGNAFGSLEHLSSIGTFAFGGCNLGSIFISKDAEVATNAFNGATITSVTYNAPTLTKQVFNSATVNTFTLMDNVTYVGAGNFAKAGSVSASLRSVQTIEASAFKGATLATDISIPAGAVVGSNAFENAELKNVSYNAETASYAVFKGATMDSLTLGDSTTEIAANAFQSSTIGGDVLKLGKVETIEKYAFQYAKLPATVIIPETATYYNNHVFFNVTGGKTLLVYGAYNMVPTALTHGSSFETVVITADIVNNDDVTYGDNAKAHNRLTSMPAGHIIYMTNDTSRINAKVPNNNGAVGVTNGGTFAEDTTFTSGTLATPTKDGAIFDGWYANAEFTGERVTNTANNKIYYAKWVGMDDIELQYGGEQKITVTGVELSNYQSDNSSVATVDTNGTVKAVGVGTATISANGNYNEQTTTFKMTVTVTPRVLTYTNKDGTPGSGSITYNYSGGHHALSASLTFKWADEPSKEVTLAEGTDINYTYAVTDSEGQGGGTTQTYDYLPMPAGTYNDVQFNLLNENYTFALSGEESTGKTLEIDVVVQTEGSLRAYLASAWPKADQNFVYTGEDVLPVEGTLNAYEQDNTSSDTVDIGTFTINIEGLNGTSFNSEVSEIPAGTDLSAITDLALPTEPGTYIITASAANDDYYLYKSLVFTISKATVTIKADDKSVYVGAAMPTLTYTVSGLVGNDELSGTVSLFCETNDTNTAGTYTITPSGAAVPNTEHYNGEINYQSGTLTVSARSSGGGGGSSSGGSSSSNVSGSGDDVSISASGGSVTASQMESAVKKADEGAAITIKATGSSKISLPASGLESAADNDNSLTLDLRYGEVTLSPEALSAVADQAGSTVTMTVAPVDTDELNSRQQAAVGDAPVFDLTIRSGSTVISDFGGGLATVSIPYELPSNQDPAGVVVWFMDDDGNITPCETMYDTRTETVIFTTRHFSKYVIGYEEPTVFTDVSEDAYYADAVLWAVANGVTNGTSATTFSPDMAVSRAQMVTFLWRAHGSPKATGTNPFTDVSTSDYYYDAVLWAVANGVTNGTSATTFSPDMAVTRAQAVTFQWRAAGSPVVSGSSFSDVATNAYYVNAVTWAVANGITNGTGGNTFSPDVVVSRAQAVTFLYRELG